MLFVADAPLTDQAMQDFALKMEPYYVELGIPTETNNASLHELQVTYWGGTVWSGRCTSQVYLSERFTRPGHPFYGTPMWKYVLAHEWSHVAQGEHCWDNEGEAELIALAVLAEAGEWGVVITALEWMFTLSVPDEELDQLHLSPRVKSYYQAVDLPIPGSVEMLLNDQDGVFELRTGKLYARSLWRFIRSLPGSGEGVSEAGAR
jgi:hypothetical protein